MVPAISFVLLPGQYLVLDLTSDGRLAYSLRISTLCVGLLAMFRVFGWVGKHAVTWILVLHRIYGAFRGVTQRRSDGIFVAGYSKTVYIRSLWLDNLWESDLK